MESRRIMGLNIRNCSMGTAPVEEGAPLRSRGLKMERGESWGHSTCACCFGMKLETHFDG